MDIFGNFSKLTSDKRKRSVQDTQDIEYVYSDVTLEGIGRVEEKDQSSSIFSVKAIVAIVFLILVFKLFMIQVVQGEQYRLKAESNRVQPRILDGQRGIITDKDGAWLARNKPSFGIGIYPSDLPKDKADRDSIYGELSLLTGKSTADIKDQAEKDGLFSFSLVLLQDDIQHDEALVLTKKTAGLQGVVIVQKPTREYIELPGLSHILGYTGKIALGEIAGDHSDDYWITDRIGKAGLEVEYEKYLKGRHGVEQIEVDSKGNIVRVLVQEGQREPAPGKDISLYLDRNLQIKTAESLQQGIEEAKELTGNEVNAGVAVVMDVKTGGILSMVSLPDYNNNLLTSKNAKDYYNEISKNTSSPMFDRAIKGTYPPGSIIKIVMASAGLTEGVITKNTSFDTPSEIKIGDFVFPDWKDHGITNIERAIAESNNIFFYAIGGGFDKIRGIGIEKMKEYWQKFGLGKKTGIDLPGEAAGFLPDSEWKKQNRNEPWYIGDTYHAAIGQGDLLVTPIQMLRATAAVANGGTLLRPQLVKKILDHEGNVVEQFGPSVEDDQIASPEIIRTIQEGMRLTVTGGSARNLSDLPVSVAGKTGTAQFLGNQKTHAWFECYAPYENPEIAIIVMVEGGGGGNEIAAPVAKNILSYYFSR